MSVSFKDFNSFVGVIAAAKFPIMIRGQHGIGKSELVYQFAKRVNMPVVERRASQMTEGDLVGLPVIKGDSTAWNPPDWYKQACTQGVVLFMDEIDRATTEVRQGFFQLADSRALNGHTLHPDTMLFAAVNGGKHGNKYQVNDMDPAELDRWCVYDVEPTVEDWLSYASTDNRVHPIIVDFIRHNHVHLENKRDFEPGKVYASRRSWERLSRTINSANLMPENNYKANLATVFNIACGFVGFEAAVAFKDHAERYESMLMPADILAGRGLDKVKGWTLNQHVAMVEKMLAQGGVAADMPDDNLHNLAKFFLLLPSEAAMKFYTGISSNKTLMPLIIRLHKVEVDGKALKSHMTAMLQKKN